MGITRYGSRRQLVGITLHLARMGITHPLARRVPVRSYWLARFQWGSSTEWLPWGGWGPNKRWLAFRLWVSGNAWLARSTWASFIEWLAQETWVSGHLRLAITTFNWLSVRCLHALYRPARGRLVVVLGELLHHVRVAHG